MGMKSPFTGNVKEYSLESYVYDENNKEILDSKFTYKYNQDHSVSEVSQYDADNKLVSTSSYSYNENLKLQDVVTKTPEGEIKQHIIYEYKEDKLSQITDTAADYRIITLFDDLGNPSEKQNLLDDDTVYSSTKYINLYDKSNRLVEKHTVFPDRDSEWVDKYEYNGAGLLTKEERIRNGFASVTLNSYNDKGDLILSEFNPGEFNGETTKKDIVYDGDNNIIEVKEYRKGWCYQDRNDEFGLTSISKYSYTR